MQQSHEIHQRLGMKALQPKQNERANLRGGEAAVDWRIAPQTRE
jgi:hypothetical protein